MSSPAKKLILVGYMGSGKSSFGKALATHFSIPFIDLDHLIEEENGMPISQIFEHKGEVYFRDQEHIILKKLLESGGEKIIALGGGTPCYERNIKLISEEKDSYCIYLKTTIKIFTERLFVDKDKRPLLHPYKTKDALKDFLQEHLAKRDPFYSRIADKIFFSQEEDPDKILEELISVVSNILA